MPSVVSLAPIDEALLLTAAEVPGLTFGLDAVPLGQAWGFDTASQEKGFDEAHTLDYLWAAVASVGRPSLASHISLGRAAPMADLFEGGFGAKTLACKGS